MIVGTVPLYGMVPLDAVMVRGALATVTEPFTDTTV